MRILMCTSDVPLHPTSNGSRRQLQGLIPELARRHEVRLIGYRHPDQSQVAAIDADMRVISYVRPSPLQNAKDLAFAVALRRPLRVRRLTQGLIGPLRHELQEFRPDIVHVGPGKLAWLRRELDGRPSVLVVMDTWHLNVDARAQGSRGLRAAAFRADAKRIRRFESTEYRGFDRVIVCNRRDLTELRDRDPTLPLAVIPIGLNTSAFAPDPHAVVDRSRIVFHGALDYPPNVRAVEFMAKSILPRVRAVVPDAHMVIVGRDPAPAVLNLGALEGVNVIGPVDEIRTWLTGSRVWVGPFLDGTGMKNKLLEAMSADLPAVVTPLGRQGLEDVTSGRELLIGRTDRELAAHIVRVLEDDVLARFLGHAGGAYVRPRYDWSTVGRAYASLYEEILAEKVRPSFPGLTSSG